MLEEKVDQRTKGIRLGARAEQRVADELRARLRTAAAVVMPLVHDVTVSDMRAANEEVTDNALFDGLSVFAEHIEPCIPHGAADWHIFVCSGSQSGHVGRIAGWLCEQLVRHVASRLGTAVQVDNSELCRQFKRGVYQRSSERLPGECPLLPDMYCRSLQRATPFASGSL